MILLIDARNCVYPAVYASDKEYQRTGKHSASKHPMSFLLRLMSTLVRNYKPTTVQVFWDAPRETVWRRKIWPGYKKRDPDCHWIKDLAGELDKTQRTARELFRYMNIHQFFKPRMEADDLIYAACKLQHNQPMVICSSDSDMTQIMYTFNSVSIYNPAIGAEMPPPRSNIVLQKVLMGDKADKIPGYVGIGPKKALLLSMDIRTLERFLEQQGKDIFLRNMLLIDLAVCPYLLNNQIYVSSVLGTELEFSRDKLIEIAHKHHASVIIDEFADAIAPFKRLNAPAPIRTVLAGNRT